MNIEASTIVKLQLNKTIKKCSLIKNISYTSSVFTSITIPMAKPTCNININQNN